MIVFQKGLYTTRMAHAKDGELFVGDRSGLRERYQKATRLAQIKWLRGGVAGVVRRDTTLAVAIAAIQLMWVGGFYLPPDLAREAISKPSARPVPR